MQVTDIRKYRKRKRRGIRGRPEVPFSLEERFWAKVEKHKSGCWEWTAGGSNGYGSMHVRPSEHQKRNCSHLAHHVSWFLYYGNWPKKCILHHCDNRRCVRPSHLYEGTKLDNALDRENRDRGNHVNGIRCRQAVLNKAKVRAIRLSHLPDAVWAKKFGVTRTAIHHARIGLSWKEVINPPPVRRQQ